MVLFGTNQASANRTSASPRNIIFILSDDHRYDYMGFMKTVPWLKTPNMDRMAREGAHLKNAYVTTALCSPSRASILTGLYAHSHTIVDNHAPTPEGLTYFPELLQKKDYQTAFIGKWHMGDETDEPQPGFDHWVSFKGQGVYKGPMLNINGTRKQYGDDFYITKLLTDLAVDWLDQNDPGKPFFLYLSHKAVHSNFTPEDQYVNSYADAKFKLPPTYEQSKTGEDRKLLWPDWVRRQRVSWHGVDYPYHKNLNFQELVSDYCETLRSVDDSIGAIMNWLEANDLADSTLLVYMGDNGFSWGEHGLIDKRHFYEESARVPLLVRCPELVEGSRTIDALVQNIDLAPTFLELAGLQKTAIMQGQSWVRLLAGNDEGWRDRVFYEYYWEYDFPMTPTVFGIRSGRYKYIRYHGIWDRNELYDLENDPHEMYNLIESRAHQKIIRELAAELYAWLEETGGMQIPLKPTIKHRWGDYLHSNQY